MKSFRRLAIATSLAVMATAQAANLVPVHDEPSLYQEISRPGNEGAVLVLAPRRYILDRRLELQHDMTLRGQAGDASAVIIDASELTTADFSATGPTGAFASGAIRMGRGRNALEWLTVEKATAGASAITTDLGGGGDSTSIRIFHVVARASPRGLDARNLNAPGRKMSLEVVESRFLDNTDAPGQGIRILNASASGARIDARLRGNVSTGNVAGCIVSNLNSHEAAISVHSDADVFDNNANGCVLLGGLTQATATTLAEDNVLVFQSRGGSFRHNTRGLPAAFPHAGGIVVVGGQSQGPGKVASGNSVHIELHDALWGDNQGWDLQAWGAQAGGAQAAGTENEVTIKLHGGSGQAWTTERQSAPPEAEATNSVRIVR